MSSKILFCLAALGMTIHLAACTSDDKKTEMDGNSEVQSLNDGTSTPAPGSEALLSDSLPEEALGGGSVPPSAAPPADQAATAVPTENGAPAEPPLVLGDTPTPPMAEANSPTSTETPPSTDAMMGTSTSMEPTTPVEEKPKVVSAPLQKMAMKPWKVGKDWFNGVYFARPGDSLEQVSQNIYGEDKTALLKKGNPTYKSREPKPGDKIYYSSPKRPTDQEQMLTWYEDQGQQPQVYVAKNGDNLRKISKNLLGYDNAWKETWASNQAIESKSSLAEGTEVRYWAAAAPPAPAIPAETAAAPSVNAPPANAEMPPPPPPNQAANEMPPPPMPQDMAPPPPPPQGMNDMPPPPPPNEMPPPPPPSQAANDIPPPPPMDNNPPQLPPVAGHAAKVKGGEEKTGMDEDTMMALGTVAVAAAGVAALLVIRRRRKQNALDSQMSESTHVGT